MINKKYTSTKKNGGNIPEIKDERTRYVPIACGKCIECKKKKANEWKIRLNEELKINKNAKFVTLSFSDASFDELEAKYKTKIANVIATKAVRLFLERWRKIYGKSVKHWFVTEIGENGTERLHLHGIMFTEVENEIIENIWKYGNVFIGDYVNEKTISYIVKYLHKPNIKYKDYNSKIFSSKGIGSNYIDSYNAQKNKFKEKGGTNDKFKLNNGKELSLPIYYRNKIYSEEERENLWIEKLDQEKRFVLGKEIDVSTEEGMNEYDFYKLEARKKNKRWGYGDDNKSNEEVYNRNARRIKYLTKVNKQRNE